LDKWVKR